MGHLFNTLLRAARAVKRTLWGSAPRIDVAIDLGLFLGAAGFVAIFVFMAIGAAADSYPLV
jgi:hypothetical protein